SRLLVLQNSISQRGVTLRMAERRAVHQADRGFSNYRVVALAYTYSGQMHERRVCAVDCRATRFRSGFQVLVLSRSGHNPRLPAIPEIDVEDLPEPLAQSGSENRSNHLHAP